MATQYADLLLHNGTVHTVDPVRPRARAVAVRDGVITAVGTDEEVRELAGPSTETIDLRGRTLLPGFQDGHVHVSGGGLERHRCDLSEVHGRDEYLALISRYAAEHPDAAWITGGGWAMDAFPGGMPTREDLDRVVPDRPVFLSNRDHHGAWVNSVALERAGIDARTPDPGDGRIERDARGEPGGTLQEGAMALVQRVVPPPTTREVAEGILEGQQYLHSLGITAWQEAIVGSSAAVPDCFDAYVALDAAGLLTATVVGALWWERDRGEGQLETLLSRRERAGAGRRFSAPAVKFMQDGVCENFTAAMLAPYLDRDSHETRNAGKSFFDPAELERFVTLVDAEGFQAHFHAIGDRAVREVLDAVEAARRANSSATRGIHGTGPGGSVGSGGTGGPGGSGGSGGPSANRHCAAHIQVVHPEDVPRFAALGMIANGQPLWACNEPQMTELTLPFLGPQRSSRQYPFGSLLREGSRLCFGSDWPVSTPDVLAQVHVAVNRTVPPGAGGGGELEDEPFLPDERVDLSTAIEAFTMGSAYLNRLEEKTGSVTVGKRADLVVLDQDLFSAAAGEIALVGVDLTFVDGQPVYDRSAP